MFDGTYNGTDIREFSSKSIEVRERCIKLQLGWSQIGRTMLNANIKFKG
jgi:hypothetical protein